MDCPRNTNYFDFYQIFKHSEITMRTSFTGVKKIPMEKSWLFHLKLEEFIDCLKYFGLIEFYNLSREKEFILQAIVSRQKDRHSLDLFSQEYLWKCELADLTTKIVSISHVQHALDIVKHIEAEMRTKLNRTMTKFTI